MAATTSRSFDYLESLKGISQIRLYQQPSTALAIFRRMLPHLAKSLVLAMLYISQPLAAADLEAWVRPEARRERDNALSLLTRLHIVEVVSAAGKGRAYRLSNGFADSLRQALTGGGEKRSFGVPGRTAPDRRLGVEQLDGYARAKWEDMLSYMVGSAAGGAKARRASPISATVVELLQVGNLVRQRGSKVEITEEGFAFLLQDVNSQVWAILVLYMAGADERKIDPADILSFLFLLGSLELGQDYSRAPLTELQAQVLSDLADFGIIHLSSDLAASFYPTRLATTLTSDASALRDSAAMGGMHSTASSSGDASGYIIMETNYRLYAYTTSALQIAILELFARLETRYPNMVAGKVTRRSVRRAVGMGITADQIIAFLSAHAHPQMRRHNPVMPATVVDQIRLWQLEGERMDTTRGYLFKDFVDEREYLDCARFADEVGVLRWKSDRKRLFFATQAEQLKLFVGNRKKRKAGQT